MPASDDTQPTADAERARRPLPAYVTASVAWHAAALGALALPEARPWALAAVAANHALLVAGGLSPRSRWLGSNWTHLPDAAAARGEIAITIDDGPDPDVTPRVLDLLERDGARATFFCIAARARAHRALCRQIVERGHSVQNHTDRHSSAFSLLGVRRLEREIVAAEHTLADITGVRPRFFRAPAGLRNPLLAPVLQRLDLQLVSWTRRGFDTVRRDPAAMLARLADRLAPGDILLAHDGNATRSASGVPLVVAVLPALLERARSLGLVPVTLPAAAADSGAAHGVASP
jgi:peptidoglycan/xylan/chitin deacetylase (PgdA/CDA1 family)